MNNASFVIMVINIKKDHYIQMQNKPNENIARHMMWENGRRFPKKAEFDDKTNSCIRVCYI